MRVIVVGVGGVGAMAAWRLSAAGHTVTALEQFRLDHDRGSSYGDSRIVRRVYPNPIYTRMMGTAYELWDRLMAESGDAALFVRSGGLFLGPSDHSDVIGAEHALQVGEVPFERLDAAECMRRFPGFRLRPDERALFEPSMGYARASRAVRAAAGLAARAGAEIREEVKVRSIEDGAESVRIILESGETLEADRAVIAAGPWAAPLLAPLGVHLPVTVSRQPYVHLEPQRNPEWFEPGIFPAWLDVGANTYGFPRLGDVPGVKIGMHDYGPPSDPLTVDRMVSDADRAAVVAFAAERFPALSDRVAYEKVCLYTVTPDNDFIIDTVPGMQRLVLISACSGHGFKFTPLMGQIAADLVGGNHTCCDLSPFRLSRFDRNDSSRIHVTT